ncbi:MAG: adenylate/guanylate cyclase domain-containing protein [Herpetosiphonaceae bacterium]|nr:MAG: adenylate/guanylate cyclase domain-containing protein [Herpetosiphonaceae bacterium]
MPSLLQTLASYVPAVVIKRLAVSPETLASPVGERFSAAILFADISGFTPLAERLAQRGPAGAEELSQLLNAYFGQMIDLVSIHGGDIVKFAGDALLAMWPSAEEGENLATVTLRAAQCGLLIQSMLHNQQVSEEVRLSLKIGIGTGTVLSAHVGGVHGRWDLLLTGDPVSQASRAEEQAQPGEIILSPEAWALIDERCLGVPLPAGHVRLLDLPEPLPMHLRQDPLLRHEAEMALRAYLPGVILSRLAAGQSDWLAELRRVTVLFVSLPDLTDTVDISQAQVVIRTLQSVLYHYEGSINKINVDDKGVSLIAALGLPPLAHEDDPARAVETALAMREELHRLGIRCAIGVTTGRAFCGSVGSTTRREYTMIGDVVNLAARLMQLAGTLGQDILCDAATYQAVRSHARIEFTELSAIAIKGKRVPVTIYYPAAAAHSEPGFQPRRLRSGTKSEMVGRIAERTLLSDELQALLRGGEGRVMIIEGEAGIGKSRLIEELIQKANVLGLYTLVGAGDAVEHATPYFAWRPIFRFLLHLEDLPGVEQQRNQVLSLLQEQPELLRLAPLLNAALPLDLPENDVTRYMTGKVRADNTHALLVSLLSMLPNDDQPKVLIIEDAHWLDSASWALLQLVSQQVRPLLLVIATRPMSDQAPAEYRSLLQLADTRYLRLETLSPQEMLTLICQRLGVSTIPEIVGSLILEKSQGNPFYAEELAYSLRDRGLIVIADGECHVSSRVRDMRSINVPDTVQGVIISRIDQLQPSQQLVLKTASVIGRVFPYNTLYDIYPIPADKPALPDHLQVLSRLDITPLERPIPDLAYIFKHIITQEVAYDMMLFAQRRELHQAVALWYEQIYAGDLSPFYAFLAHHWAKAGDSHKAIYYLEKAGEQALKNYANEEAVGFFTQVLELDAARQPAGSPRSTPEQADHADSHTRRRARWELQLGQAYVNWVKLGEGRAHLESGLKLIGYAVPESKPRLAGSLLKNLLRQILHRLRPGRYVGGHAAQRERLLDAARAYEALTIVYYFANEVLPTLYAAVRTLNLAELAGPSPELARGYASLGTIMGFIPLHGIADAYCRRALEAAAALDDLPAQAWVAVVTGVYYAGVGRWQEAETLLKQVIELSDHLGDRYRRSDGSSNLLAIRYLQGDIRRSLELANELYAASRSVRDAHNQGWALRGKIIGLLAQGAFDEARICAQEGQRILTDHPEVVDEPLKVDIEALLALAYVRQGRREEALAAASSALAKLSRMAPTSYLSLPSYAAVADVYLTLWEEAGPAADRALIACAGRACRELRRYTRVFPIGRPHMLLYHGLYSWQRGKHRRAQRLWNRALVAARRLAMPYDQALVHLTIARHLPAVSSARQTHLEQACTIFERLAATYPLTTARSLISADQS